MCPSVTIGVIAGYPGINLRFANLFNKSTPEMHKFISDGFVIVGNEATQNVKLNALKRSYLFLWRE